MARAKKNTVVETPEETQSVETQLKEVVAETIPEEVSAIAPESTEETTESLIIDAPAVGPENLAQEELPVGVTEAQTSATSLEEVEEPAPEQEPTKPAETGDVAPLELEAPAEDDGETKLILSLPLAMFEQSPGSMQRLKAAIGSKQTLLKKALGTDNLDIVIEEDRVTFPWFTLTSENNAEEMDAYSKLVFALSKKAITQTRVDPVEKIPEDLQLGMRLYLINLNFKGDEFKTARAVLMRNFRTAGGGPVGPTKYELTMPEVYKP